MTAGLCEAIKHGALAGGSLYDRTSAYLLERNKPGDDRGDRLAELVAEQVAFKASIVQQDETEQTTRKDGRSRKVLNFGHTFAHALENVTNYRRLRHGEAVGYGILVAGELSKNLDFLPQNELNSLYDVVHRAGGLPAIADISPESIFRAIRADKKATGDGVNWILLKCIGKPVIVSGSDIPRAALSRAVNKILKS
jgi:3-dehydroquinate synthase